MLYVATGIDPLPSACDGGHEAVSAMGFLPLYVGKTEKKPQLSSYPTSQPLTQDIGPTPLDAQSGGEWEQSIANVFNSS
jgi:hypothetical protein